MNINSHHLTPLSIDESILQTYVEGGMEYVLLSEALGTNSNAVENGMKIRAFNFAIFNAKRVSNVSAENVFHGGYSIQSRCIIYLDLHISYDAFLQATYEHAAIPEMKIAKLSLVKGARKSAAKFVFSNCFIEELVLRNDIPYLLMTYGSFKYECETIDLSGNAIGTKACEYDFSKMHKQAESA
mgnify:CR=1 FL=1